MKHHNLLCQSFCLSICSFNSLLFWLIQWRRYSMIPNAHLICLGKTQFFHDVSNIENRIFLCRFPIIMYLLYIYCLIDVLIKLQIYIYSIKVSWLVIVQCPFMIFLFPLFSLSYFQLSVFNFIQFLQRYLIQMNHKFNFFLIYDQ